MSSDWFCVAATGRKEAVAEAALLSVGFTAIFPRMQVPTQYGDKYRLSVVPMFSKYLFVLGEQDEITSQLVLWNQMRLQTGIERLVRINGKPAIVDPLFMLDLRLKLHPVTKILPLQQPPKGENPFNIDDIVRFKEGSLSELLFVVSQLNGPSRVSLLWRVLGRECTMRNIATELLLKETPSDEFD